MYIANSGKEFLTKRKILVGLLESFRLEVFKRLRADKANKGFAINEAACEH